MSNEIVPAGGAQSWSEILEKFNIPKLIAGPAGEAFSRLIGKAVDIPAAKLEQISQGIKDKTEAKSLVAKTLSQEVAKNVALDKELVQRAADSFLAKELRKQENKEAVAQKTIEILAADKSNESKNQNEPQGNFDQDWLNLFEQFAENASSDRLRSIWARTLAGEIRKPKSFSLQTLRFLSELDQDVAQLFEELSPAIVQNQFIPFQKKFHNAPHFSHILTLEEAGLLSGSQGMFNITLQGTNIIPVGLNDGVMIIRGDGALSVQVSALLLSKIGREISTLLKTPATLDAAKEFSDLIPKNGLKSIMFQAISENPPSSELLWERPKEPSS